VQNILEQFVFYGFLEAYLPIWFEETLLESGPSLEQGSTTGPRQIIKRPGI
jgi:hypothetical protein